MLMYANMAIDAIQSGKTAWLNQYVQDESVRKPLQHFVDAQTEFTKQIAKTFLGSNWFCNAINLC